jgi:hypothetical protein
VIEADDLLSTLRTYRDEGVIFESSSRGRRYRVLDVGHAGATVERVDGGDAEVVTAQAFVQVAAKVLATGVLPLSDVPGNRLQGATIAQASTLGLAADRRTLVDIMSDGLASHHFRDHLRNLRVDRSGGFARLYKPVLLEVVLRAIDAAELEQNHIFFDWLVPRFMRRMHELGYDAEERSAAYAFANLAGDVIWLLAYKPGAAPLDTSSPSPAIVRERISHARLKDRLWALLQDPPARAVLLDALRTTWLQPLEGGPMIGLQDRLERVMDGYLAARRENFGGSHPMSSLFNELEATIASHKAVTGSPTLRVHASVGIGNWAKVPWVSILGPGQTIRAGVYCVYLFRADMSGVYATFNQGVTTTIDQHGTTEGRKILRSRADTLRQHCRNLVSRGFSADHKIDLRVPAGLGRNYESSTVAHKLYQADSVPDDAELGEDLGVLIDAYNQYLADPLAVVTDGGDETATVAEGDFDLAEGVEALIRYLEGTGFKYEPWHVAQYVTAVRTKPFTILAGITGTGKSQLPARVAEATGSECRLVPVRPDWTDSSDVLGYTDLQGRFRPGRVMEILRDAMNQDDRHWVCIIDEMNLARVEQYFAEVLSHIEDRREHPSGGFASGPLLSQALSREEEEWASVQLPANLALVGTVNMDESAHGFSRKVLDRAFTLELSDVDLNNWRSSGDSRPEAPTPWPNWAWHPRANRLGRIGHLREEEVRLIDSVVSQLVELNTFLRRGQLQLGYRSRDEIALFLLHARDVESAFRDRNGDRVDPMDLAIQMKVLPRIIGGSNSIRKLLSDLLGWAADGVPRSADQAREIVARWDESGLPDSLSESRLPRTAARLCLMWQRLELEGFTSYWL